MAPLLRAAAIAVLVGLALAGTAAARSTWQSNFFYNPSGNIQCQFMLHPLTLECESNSNGHVVYLWPTTPAYSDSGHVPGELGTRWGHVLGYGQSWHSHQFECLSTYGGMRCWTSSLAHGFFINAWEIQRW